MSKPMLLGVNFVVQLMPTTNAWVESLAGSVDFVLDEAGFTNWGAGPVQTAAWLNLIEFMEYMQQLGKGYLV
jgi:hypothetical protein